VCLCECDVNVDDTWANRPHTDVALVIGANDVTNPAARADESSPIYGMPILDVDKAENVVVLKRSMNPGFAGIDNHLYYEPQTVMLFGDAKDSVTKLVQETKTASPDRVGERLRIGFLACYGLAAIFLAAATFASGSAATICGILSGL